jgi:heparin binding hemagglutinin HbhA
MKVVTDIRKSAPAQAVVGVTDLAVGKLRSAQADLSAKASTLPGKAAHGAETLRVELHPAKIQADVQNLPNRAITKTLEAVGKAEETYDDLTARGKWLVENIRRHSSTQDLLAQGRSAVTTVRKASDETLDVAKATLTAGRREAAQLAGSLIGEGKSVATKATKPAAKKPATKPAAKKATKKAPAKKATKPAAKKAAKKAPARKAPARKAPATKATAPAAANSTAPSAPVAPAATTD